MVKHCEPNECFVATIKYASKVELEASNETLSLDLQRGCSYFTKGALLDINEYENTEPFLVLHKLIGETADVELFNYDNFRLRLDRIERRLLPVKRVKHKFKLVARKHCFEQDRVLASIDSESLASCFHHCRRFGAADSQVHKRNCFSFSMCVGGSKGFRCLLSDQMFNRSPLSNDVPLKEHSQCSVYEVDSLELFIQYRRLRIQGDPLVQPTTNLRSAKECADSCLRSNTCQSFTFTELRLKQDSTECRLFGRNMFELYHDDKFKHSLKAHNFSTLYSGSSASFTLFHSNQIN
jgi:hypothetical protein